MLVSNSQVEPSPFKLPVEDHVVVKIPVFPNLTVKTEYVRTRLSQSFLFHFFYCTCVNRSSVPCFLMPGIISHCDIQWHILWNPLQCQTAQHLPYRSLFPASLTILKLSSTYFLLLVSIDSIFILYAFSSLYSSKLIFEIPVLTHGNENFKKGQRDIKCNFFSSCKSNTL